MWGVTDRSCADLAPCLICDLGALKVGVGLGHSAARHVFWQDLLVWSSPDGLPRVFRTGEFVSFMPQTADSGIRCGLRAEFCIPVLNGFVADCSEVRYSGQCQSKPFFVWDTPYDERARF